MKMISLRGNKKIAALEQRILGSVPEKLSHNRLLQRAIYQASESEPNWIEVYMNLRRTEADDIEPPVSIQARLDPEEEKRFDALKETIRATIGLDRCTNLFAWQMLLSNLAIQEERFDVAPAPLGLQMNELPSPSRSDALTLISKLVRLLEKENPTPADIDALAKVTTALQEQDS